MSEKKLTVDEVMAKTFAPETGREPRSNAYRAGVRAMLALHIDGIQPSIPYWVGSAEFDAYFAGREEGKAIVKTLEADK